VFVRSNVSWTRFAAKLAFWYNPDHCARATGLLPKHS
jgi:hypothetical protein